MKRFMAFFVLTFSAAAHAADVKKYFLDFDKIHRYPLTFVIKSTDSEETLLNNLKKNALKIYSIKSVVDRYMGCIEEIINIPKLHKCFISAYKQGYLKKILDEIILQSKIEFNYSDSEEIDED